MDYREYLVGYGTLGDFGRFRPCYPLACQRGERVVVRTAHGLELGTILCEATPGHAHFLPNTSVGELVRRAAARDEETAVQMAQRARELFAKARVTSEEQGVALEVLDAEVLLDGRHARLHYLSATAGDPRPLLDALMDQCGVFVTLHNLAAPVEAEEPHGCGEENCGGGNCGSCGSSGCSSCGHAETPPVSAAEAQRVALL